MGIPSVRYLSLQLTPASSCRKIVVVQRLQSWVPGGLYRAVDSLAEPARAAGLTSAALEFQFNPGAAERVLHAFETYHQGCEAALEQLVPHLDASLLQVTRSAIREARSRFLDSLGK